MKTSLLKILFIGIFALTLSTESLASGTCVSCNQKTPPVTNQISEQQKICEKFARENPTTRFEQNPDFGTGVILSWARCWQGGIEGILGYPKEIIDAVKLLPEAVKSLPPLGKMAYDNAGTIFKLSPLGFSMRMTAEAGRGICEWTSRQVSNSQNDPVACAAITAPLVSEESRMKLRNAQALLTMLEEFMKESWSLIKSQFPEYPCLAPYPSLQSKFWCNLITKSFLTALGPAQLKWGVQAGTAGIRTGIRATDWFKNMTASTSKLLKAMREAQVAEGLSFSEATERTARILQTRDLELKTQVVRFRFKGGDLVEKETTLGKQLIYNTKKTRTINGKTITETEEIVIGYDAATNAINAQGDLGRAFVGDVLTQGSQRGETIAAKIDAMALGKVNNATPVKLSDGSIVESYSAGDFYLKRVAEIVRENTRTAQGQDLVARWGGDEIALVLRDASSSESRKVLERINAAVHADPDLNAIFAASPGMQGLKPGVSISATVVRPGEGISAFQRADVVGSEVKKEFYESFGLDATKYGGKRASVLPVAHPEPPIIPAID